MTYSDFGPPPQRFRDELARKVGNRAEMRGVKGALLKKPSKKPAITLMVNDLI